MSDLMLLYGTWLQEQAALRAEVERLKGALEPFAVLADKFDGYIRDGDGISRPWHGGYAVTVLVTVSSLREARAATDKKDARG